MIPMTAVEYNKKNRFLQNYHKLLMKCTLQVKNLRIAHLYMILLF